MLSYTKTLWVSIEYVQPETLHDMKCIPSVPDTQCSSFTFNDVDTEIQWCWAHVVHYGTQTESEQNANP